MGYRRRGIVTGGIEVGYCGGVLWWGIGVGVLA